MNLIGDFLSRRYLLFLFSGGTASAVGIVLRLLFGLFMDYVPSIVAAYVLSTLTAYLLNRFLVFKATGKRYHVEIAKFYIVNVIGLLQTIAISSVLAGLLKGRLSLPQTVSETLAHVAALSTLAVTSFLLYKYWTFAPRKQE